MVGRRNVASCLALALLAAMLLAPAAMSKPIPPSSPASQAFGGDPSIGGPGPASTGGDPEEPFERMAPAEQGKATATAAGEESTVPSWVRSLLQLLIWLGIRH